jgi:hypothetical protein
LLFVDRNVFGNEDEREKSLVVVVTGEYALGLIFNKAVEILDGVYEL